jgi:isoleucyl-tRNA synthetase
VEDRGAVPQEEARQGRGAPAEFRAECRAYAEKWVGVQREQFQRLGVMGEWDDPYLTMNYEAEAKIVASS